MVGGVTGQNGANVIKIVDNTEKEPVTNRHHFSMEISALDFLKKDQQIFVMGTIVVQVLCVVHGPFKNA